MDPTLVHNGSGSLHGTQGGASARRSKPIFLRLKRRREEAPVDRLVLDSIPKRRRLDTLLNGMGSMSITQPSGQAQAVPYVSTQQSQQPSSQASQAATAKRVTFQRMSTEAASSSQPIPGSKGIKTVELMSFLQQKRQSSIVQTPAQDSSEAQSKPCDPLSAEKVQDANKIASKHFKIVERAFPTYLPSTVEHVDLAEHTTESQPPGTGNPLCGIEESMRVYEIEAISHTSPASPDAADQAMHNDSSHNLLSLPTTSFDSSFTCNGQPMKTHSFKPPSPTSTEHATEDIDMSRNSAAISSTNNSIVGEVVEGQGDFVYEYYALVPGDSTPLDQLDGGTIQQTVNLDHGILHLADIGDDEYNWDNVLSDIEDSDDSNAEEYFGNDYPDEEDPEEDGMPIVVDLDPSQSRHLYGSSQGMNHDDFPYGDTMRDEAEAEFSSDESLIDDVYGGRENIHNYNKFAWVEDASDSSDDD